MDALNGCIFRSPRGLAELSVIADLDGHLSRVSCNNHNTVNVYHPTGEAM
jgi:hypothetical protein